MQELEFNTIRLEFPDEFKEIDKTIKSLYDRKVQELKNRRLLFGPPTKTNIIKLQGQLMATMNFGKKDFNKLVGVSVAAQAIKIAHLIELFETQTLFTTSNYIRNLYEQAASKTIQSCNQYNKKHRIQSSFNKNKRTISKRYRTPKTIAINFTNGRVYLRKPKKQNNYL